MGLKRIWGFLLDKQSMSASWGVVTVKETCLVEMDSALEDIIEVQAALPAFDGVLSEPTFTIGISYHPDRPDLLFKTADNVREHEQAGRPFWLVDITYETGQWLNDLFPGEDAGRGNIGRQRRISEPVGTGTEPAPAKQVIISPWNEPVTWSSSTRRIKATRFKDANGVTLRHTNGLPLTEGIGIDLDLEVHQFTWNVRYVGFDYDTDVAKYIGKINTTVINDFKNAPIKHVLLESCTCTENYRDVSLGLPAGQSGSGIQTFHFITINATFVIDRRTAVASPEGYFREANRRVSMHTQQLVVNPLLPIPIFSYGPIPVNARGDFAQSPWPLDPNGVAVHYEDMISADPETDFGFIDPEFPLEENLETFVNTHGLRIP